MKEHISVFIFKFLFTVLSLAIILPGIIFNDYKNVVLSYAIFSFTKITDNINGLYEHNYFKWIFSEIVLGIITTCFCFFYIAADSIYNFQQIFQSKPIYICLCKYFLVITTAIYFFIEFTLLFFMVIKIVHTKETIKILNSK